MLRMPLRHQLISIAAGLWAGASGCGSEPTRVTARECESLRDHLVEMRLATVTADVEQHRAALRASLSAFVSTCVSDITSEQLKCAMAANDPPSLVGCGAL
jgi:hypothetical protein